MCTFSYVSLRDIFICIITVYLIRFRECWHLVPLPMTLFRGHTKITLFWPTHPLPSRFITNDHKTPLTLRHALHSYPSPPSPAIIDFSFLKLKKTKYTHHSMQKLEHPPKGLPPSIPSCGKTPLKMKTFWPPHIFSNSSYLWILSISISLSRLFAKNLFEEVEDHGLIESKLSKQEVQLRKTLIFLDACKDTDISRT